MNLPRTRVGSSVAVALAVLLALGGGCSPGTGEGPDGATEDPAPTSAPPSGDAPTTEDGPTGTPAPTEPTEPTEPESTEPTESHQILIGATFGPGPPSDLGTLEPGDSVSVDLVLSNRSATGAVVTVETVAADETPPAGAFVVGPGCEQVVLGVGESCTFRLTFTPLAPGEYRADLVIELEPAEVVHPPVLVGRAG